MSWNTVSATSLLTIPTRTGKSIRLNVVLTRLSPQRSNEVADGAVEWYLRRVKDSTSKWYQRDKKNSGRSGRPRKSGKTGRQSEFVKVFVSSGTGSQSKTLIP